jgi:hypothetical protein
MALHVNTRFDEADDVENYKWRQPRSPTPRTITPRALLTPQRTPAEHALALAHADDYKSTLTSRYLDEQARGRDDGYVPASEIDGRDGENERAAAVMIGGGLESAYGRGEDGEYGSGARIRGVARAGECLELRGYDTKIDGVTHWQRVNPYGGVEMIENARGRRYVCQDEDIGCTMRALRSANGQVVAVMMDDPVELAIDRPREAVEGKRKEVVLPEVPLGPASAAYTLHARGKVLEAEACEANKDDKISEEKAKEALKCYVTAAKEQFVPAYSSIGRMYELGIGMERDYEQARGWYREGIKEGCPICANNLGVLEYLEIGEGAEKDNAASYFQEAVTLGNPAAMNNLALCLEEGIGVEQNFCEAQKYYELAAQGGVMSAFTSLGYSQIVNGELDEALDAFNAGLDFGIEDAADGVALLSDLNASKPEILRDRAESLAAELSIEALTKEVEQYADLSKRFYELLTLTAGERVKNAANRCIEEVFYSEQM